MLYAVLVGSYICSFDTWWYYISIFIRFVYIEKHIPFHCLNQFHFPKSQEHLGNCIYLHSGCCDIPFFPFENKEIILQPPGVSSKLLFTYPSLWGLPQLKKAASSPKAIPLPEWPAFNE